MPNYLTRISLIAMLAVAAPALTGPAMAQDSTGAETTAAEEAPQAAPAPDAGLELGETVSDEPQVGQPYIREMSGDWGLECLKVEEGTEPCQIFQTLEDDKGNQVANVMLFRLPEGGQAVAGALISVPLETLLTAQLTIRVDSAQPKRYPFSVCDRQGCYARIGLTAEDVAAYKRGAKASLALVPFVAPDSPVVLDLSLRGFTAGYDLMTVPTE